MSQENLPNVTPTITLSTDEAIPLIVSSIAVEELGLSPLLNAEKENLQHILDTLPNANSPISSINDLLALNDVIRETLREKMKNEWGLINH